MIFALTTLADVRALIRHGSRSEAENAWARIPRAPQTHTPWTPIALRAKFAGLFVIARHSAFRYRGTDLDVRQIGRELGVRYLLMGSVRRDAERVRITAQLVDAETITQLWAEYYDRELTGIFAVQDEVAQKIVGTLIAHISRSEFERALAKPPDAFRL